MGAVQTETASAAADPLDPERLARSIVEALADRQAEAIVLLDVSELTDLADCFVIASATSRRHFGALEDTLRKIPGAPRARREGTADGGWQLFDFASVIVHLFDPDTRGYYDLDGLWSGGRTLLRIE